MLLDSLHLGPLVRAALFLGLAAVPCPGRALMRAGHSPAAGPRKLWSAHALLARHCLGAPGPVLAVHVLLGPPPARCLGFLRALLSSASIHRD